MENDNIFCMTIIMNRILAVIMEYIYHIIEYECNSLFCIIFYQGAKLEDNF